MKKLVIFDLDGTILDTLQDLADAVNHALAENGLAQRSVAEVRAFVGNGIRNLIERSVPENTAPEMIDRVFAEFKAYYADHCADKTCPYAGISEVLNSLHAKGIRTAVVSNKADFAVQELVKQYFPGQIDYAAGEKAGIPKKPAPDSVFEVLKVMGVSAEKAVYIGDSEVDILTAENAQMDCVIVDWGFRDREQLLEAGAETVVSTPEALAALLLG